MKSMTSLLALALALQAGQAVAEEKPIRIAVVNDQSGIYSETGGRGSNIMAELAIEAFGGELLGRKIELIVQDHQNKPDLASTIVRKGFETDGYDMIADGASSAAAIAMNEIAKASGKIFTVSGAAAPQFTMEGCSPTTFHFNTDTYGLANSTAKAIVNEGGDSWYFLTADYAFGHALQADVTKFVENAGGSVTGGLRYPTGSPDMSSYLLQAQSSGAKIIGLAMAGSDTINAVKQAYEFGLTQGDQKLAGLLAYISDIHSIGLDYAQNLVLSTAFYWDLNDETRTLSAEFGKRMGGKMPTMVHAGVYSGVHHYLSGVKATGTTDSAKVAEWMRANPVNDAFNKDVKVREDGRVLNNLYLAQVKTPEESKGPYDYYKILATIPGEQAFRPLADSTCPLVKK